MWTVTIPIYAIETVVETARSYRGLSRDADIAPRRSVARVANKYALTAMVNDNRPSAIGIVIYYYDLRHLSN